MKIALITGATDGVGKATAYELAKKGYEIHVIGRSKEKGVKVLKELENINSKANHQLFIYDLADVNKNNEFLDEYIKNNEKLDFLMLNANPFPRNKRKITDSGYDTTFMVGFISRYMYTVKLEKLLKNTKDSRVMHIGDLGMYMKINFDKLKNPTYGRLRSINNTYWADFDFMRYIAKNNLTSVTHEHMSLGAVNTRQIKELGKVLRFMSQLGNLIEPEEMAKIISEHIDTLDSKSCYGKAFSRKKVQTIPKKLDNDYAAKKLIEIAERETKIDLDL